MLLDTPPDPYVTLGPAVVEALDCYGQQDLQGAARILRSQLRRFDPVKAPPHLMIMSAALLYARWTSHDTGNDSGLRWAWYGYRTALVLDGADTESAIAATSILAGVLTDRADFTLAAMLWEPVAAHHQQAGRHRDHVAARLSMAEALHKAGSCGTAIRQATVALDAYPAQEEVTGYGVLFLIRTLHLLQACGRCDEALALIRRWQPRLPTTDTGRAVARLLGCSWLGSADLAEHQRVCAGRGGHRLDLRSAQVRLAFLAALGNPHAPANDESVPGPSLTGLGQLSQPVVEALTRVLRRAGLRR
jgi:hypothetical protein